MAKKKDENAADIGNAEAEVSGIIEELKNPKLPKKIAKSAEALVRELDNTLSDLYTLSYDASNLVADAHSVPISISSKDVDRLVEMQDIVQGVLKVLYPMVSRMSRKYVGKEVEPMEGNSRKRRALKT